MHLTAPAGRGGGWARWGAGDSSSPLGSLRAWWDCGRHGGPLTPPMLFPPDRLFLLPLFTPSLLPLFSPWASGDKVGARLEALPGGCARVPGPGSGPCCPEAVSRLLPQRRWGVEDCLPSAPLPPDSHLSLFLFLIYLKASPKSPAIPS